jgi:hypothetical protein
VTVSGWALDPDQPTVSGAVHVYVDGGGTALVADVSRPDVAAAFPGAGAAHGFTLSVTVPPGGHSVCVYAIDVDSPGRNTPLGCRAVATQTALPLGNADWFSIRDGQLTVKGWAFDPDHPTDAVDVHVYVNGAGSRVLADGYRGDVPFSHPGVGTAHGWEHEARVLPGPLSVCVYAIDLDVASRNSVLGCRTFTVPTPTTVTLPVGNWERAEVTLGRMVVSGWAVDRDSPTSSLEIHTYVDGANTVRYTGIARPDVTAAVWPSGPATGWQVDVAVAVGDHRVCVYAIDRERPWTNTSFGCRTVTRTETLPVAQWDDLSLDGTALTVRGWAFDPGQGPTYRTPVHVYVDGQFNSVWNYVERPDVQAVHHGAGGWSGWTYTLNVDPGLHRVCVYAIDDESSWRNTGLGCRSLTATHARPVGHWDFTAPSTGSWDNRTVDLAGWAFDPGAPQQALTIVVRVEWGQTGVDEHPVTADASRPDVGAVFPEAGPDHGWSMTIPLHVGQNQVCVDLVGLHETRTLQCRPA